MKKYFHNAISSESPPHFQGNFSIISNENSINLGKKIIRSYQVDNQAPRGLSNSLPPMNIDQDFDSLKFSVQSGVLQGLKNSIRYKSNFYKNFFDSVSKGFNKPNKEITFMQPVSKIERSKNPSISNLQQKKRIKRILESFKDIKHPAEIDPGNSLLKAYQLEKYECNSPASTKIQFLKGSLPNLSKVVSKVNSILISSEIQDFEKRIPQPVKNRGNLWYKRLSSDLSLL